MFSRQPRIKSLLFVLSLLISLLIVQACGVKGPPLPPEDEIETPNRATKDAQAAKRNPTPTPQSR